MADVPSRCRVTETHCNCSMGMDVGVVEVLELSQARRTRETVLGEDFQQFSSSLVSPKSRFYSISPANLTAAPRSAPARCLLPIGLIPPVRGPGPAGHLLHLAAISV